MSSSNFNGLGHLVVTIAALAMCTALLLFGNANNPTVYVIASTVITYWFGASVLSGTQPGQVTPVTPTMAPAPVNVPVVAPAPRTPFLSPLTASVPVPTAPAPTEVQL